ncbi:MAG TPA: DinB family protein [Terracidiphilus sp.]|nr:DinB family protein [Terracidiphilus sp.]
MAPDCAQLAEMRDVLLETFAVNDAMNQLLLAHLDPKAWRAQLPTARPKSGRTIAQIFVHLHHSRLNWLKRNAPQLACPAALDPHRCTMKQAAAALKKSSAQCVRMLTDALSAEPGRKITHFTRDSWMPTWPAGASMFCYMFSHEAHHRGQVLMLAQLLGFRIPPRVWGGIWQWDKLWKNHGFTTRPR